MMNEIKISSCAAKVLIAVLYVQYVCMYVCMYSGGTVVFLYYVLLNYI